jgi:agmatinase
VAALDEIKDAAARLFRDGKVPLALGGEHTVTAPMVAALVDTLGPCGVVIFDAHADLRDTYEDSPWSHACVTRRLHDLPGMASHSIIQIGIRSLSEEEYVYARDRSLLLLPPCDPTPELLDRLPIAPRTYISIDLDGIDPAESPAVGTPEPGGLTYRQQLAWLAALAARTEIVGFDIVELCPRPGAEHGSFLAARLAYKCIAYHATRGVRGSLGEYSLSLAATVSGTC